MKRLAAAILSVTLLACGAAPVEDPPSIRHVLATPEPVPFEEPTHWIIEEVERDPDAVLVVEVSVPGLFERATYRRSLKRWEAPGDYRPPFLAHDESDAGGVNVLGATPDSIKVEAEFTGRGQDGKVLSVSRTFSLPWLGQFDGDFDGIGRIHAAFERVPPNR